MQQTVLLRSIFLLVCCGVAIMAKTVPKTEPTTTATMEPETEESTSTTSTPDDNSTDAVPTLVIVEYLKPRADFYIEVFMADDGNSTGSEESAETSTTESAATHSGTTNSNTDNGSDN